MCKIYGFMHGFYDLLKHVTTYNFKTVSFTDSSHHALHFKLRLIFIIQFVSNVLNKFIFFCISRKTMQTL